MESLTQEIGVTEFLGGVLELRKAKSPHRPQGATSGRRTGKLAQYTGRGDASRRPLDRDAHFEQPGLIVFLIAAFHRTVGT